MEHQINIFQRPAIGGMSGAFLASYRATQYKHRIVARGGFDTASCALVVPRAEAEWVFEQLIGCVVRVHVDNPVVPIWEGYISSIGYAVGGQTLVRSLDNMMNAVTVQFDNAASATVNTTSTTTANNTVSQGLYGVKEGRIEAGVHHNANQTHKTALRDTMLAYAYPQTTTAVGGGATIITLEMRGLADFALGWRVYENTADVLETASAMFTLLTVQGAIRSGNVGLVAETAASHPSTFGLDIVTNAGFSISRKSQSGQTYRQFIDSIVEAGSGAQQWVWGIGAYDINTGTRRVYYRPASTAVQYTVNALRDVGRVRNLLGQPVRGWNVRPDAGIRINDILVGFNQSGDDPRTGYIEAVEYDGETGQIAYATGENITLEGALGLNRYFRRHGQALTTIRMTR